MWIIPCTFHQGWSGTVSFLLSGGTGWESSCRISGQTRQKDCDGAFLHFPQLLQGWGDRSRSVQPPEPYHLGWRWHCWLRVFPRLLSGPGCLPPAGHMSKHSHRVPRRGAQAPHTSAATNLGSWQRCRETLGPVRNITEETLGQQTAQMAFRKIKRLLSVPYGHQLKAQLLWLTSHSLQLSIPLHNQWGGVWIWTSPHLLKCWMGDRAGEDTG